MEDLNYLKSKSAFLDDTISRLNSESYDVLCDVLDNFYHKYKTQTVYFDDENYISPAIICRINEDDDTMKDCVVHALHFDYDDNEYAPRWYPLSVDVRIVGEDGGYISGIPVVEDCFNWNDNEFSGYIIDQIEKGRYIPENEEEIEKV